MPINNIDGKRVFLADELDRKLGLEWFSQAHDLGLYNDIDYELIKNEFEFHYALHNLFGDEQ